MSQQTDNKDLQKSDSPKFCKSHRSRTYNLNSNEAIITAESKSKFIVTQRKRFNKTKQQ
jgi:hypothetical protein